MESKSFFDPGRKDEKRETLPEDTRRDALLLARRPTAISPEGCKSIVLPWSQDSQRGHKKDHERCKKSFSMTIRLGFHAAEKSAVVSVSCWTKTRNKLPTSRVRKENSLVEAIGKNGSGVSLWLPGDSRFSYGCSFDLTA